MARQAHHSEQDNPLALSIALTQYTNRICHGIEYGEAEILERVTPTTAELLRWWFGEDMMAARGWMNFHAGQRQAILNAIVAHEVLGDVQTGALGLLGLYQQVAPDALRVTSRQHALAAPSNAHPKYCFKMATGTGKTWVLQALLVWQVLNKTAALAEGVDDARFTRYFMIVAPGLIVYERLLDAFCGKALPDQQNMRDFESADIKQFADLFIPEAQREAIFAFVYGNLCRKEEIGQKTTGNGMIAITNWHLLAEGDFVDEQDDDSAQDQTPLAVHEVVKQLLALPPGKATGNSLDVLDKRWTRGNVLEYLAELPELLVFNDEAHHIHEVRRAGEVSEVEWQKSLMRIAQSKTNAQGRRFVQMDFSATPYNDVGRGKHRTKYFFPHIITDFDLKTAMREGLVKSVVLNQRKEIGTLPLEFKAERDEEGNPTLSEGQRVMLRAGLQKLRKLERDFAAIDPDRYPKMLVVCEDTAVTPLVTRFLQEHEGLSEDDVMSIDSGKRVTLGEKEWLSVRGRLFNVDRHISPRVIVSVLMLREGFDVSNICVIVPLRSSQAPILLEQTIGRGLRLMWREEDYADIKRENRERIHAGQEPKSLLDVLTIIEHPAFQFFYDELMQSGGAGMTSEASDGHHSAGDMVAADLCENFRAFDFGVPFIVQEAQAWRQPAVLKVGELPAFTAMTRSYLHELLRKGDHFISQDLQNTALFGDRCVDGTVAQVAGYNDYLSRLTRRISQNWSEELPRTGRICAHGITPYLQTSEAILTGWLDDYIWTQLFGDTFHPLEVTPEGENWRYLLLAPVVDHIVKVFAEALTQQERYLRVGQTQVRMRWLSEVPRLMVRESHSIPSNKCLYTRQGWSAFDGGLERDFICWAQEDALVLAFCKISDNRHGFLRLRYVKEDGLSAFYHPDFLVRTHEAVYLVETKINQQMARPNLRRKHRAALAWCERINGLDASQRGGPPWHYVMLDEHLLHEWRSKGAHLAELLDFARLRSAADNSLQVLLL